MAWEKDFRDGFQALYAEYKESRYEHALSVLNKSLRSLLDDRFSQSQRLRLRVEPGRIKSANRALLKAGQAKYGEKIAKPSDIFNILTDIVATRITCNTLSDVYSVLAAIKSVALSRRTNRTILKPTRNWIDDYIKEPKDSGYRGINMLVGVPIPVGGELKAVICEVQIRTLLQDAWGELTHEDTYKPELTVPPLVTILSKRLATALSVLDDIAQDLRGALDKIERDEFPKPPPEGEVQTEPETGEEEVQEEEGVVPTWDAVRKVFHEVFPDKKDLGSETRIDVIELMIRAEVTEDEILKGVLDKTKDVITTIEEEHRPAQLTSYGLLRYALEIYIDEAEGGRQLRSKLEEARERSDQKKTFEELYYPGRQLLGTVVHVDWSYALVRFPDGHTGILHVVEMKAQPEEYIEVSDLLEEGGSVLVEVLRTNPRERRIELRLIHYDN